MFYFLPNIFLVFCNHRSGFPINEPIQIMVKCPDCRDAFHLFHKNFMVMGHFPLRVIIRRESLMRTFQETDGKLGHTIQEFLAFFLCCQISLFEISH